jgi:PAS domain S-box-containing protein
VKAMKKKLETVILNTMDMMPAQRNNKSSERVEQLIQWLIKTAPKLTRTLPDAWEQQVLVVLKDLGLLLDAWRVYGVKLLQPLGETPYGFLRYEWKQTGSQAIFTQETAPMQELEMLGMSPWLTHLRRGDVVCTRRGDGIAQEGLWNVSPEMQTLILVPIHVENEWWGYLGIEEATQRIYEPQEVEALKGLAELLSAAIWRKRIDQQLLNIQLGADRSEDVIFMTNRLGMFMYINKAFETQYGFSKDEVFGKTPRILKSGEHAQRFYDELWNTLKSGEATSLEMVNKTKQGRLVQVTTSISPIINEYKRITGYLAIQRVA